MKKFKCWYLAERIGWISFEKEFKNEEEALAYCESKTNFIGSSIVEEVK